MVAVEVDKMVVEALQLGRLEVVEGRITPRESALKLLQTHMGMVWC